MLSNINRLKKKKDFAKVLREGRGLKEDFLVLKIAKNNLSQTRFGFVTGIKISKKAVLRNKVKRRLRDLVRLKITQIKKGFDIVFIAQPGLENKDFWEIEEIINKLLNRAKILENV